MNRIETHRTGEYHGSENGKPRVAALTTPEEVAAAVDRMHVQLRSCDDRSPA